MKSQPSLLYLSKIPGHVLQIAVNNMYKRSRGIYKNYRSTIGDNNLYS